MIDPVINITNFHLFLKWKALLLLCTADDMDRKDNELRESIKKLWPIQGTKMALLLIPQKEGKLIHL